MRFSSLFCCTALFASACSDRPAEAGSGTDTDNGTGTDTGSASMTTTGSGPDTTATTDDGTSAGTGGVTGGSTGTTTSVDTGTGTTTGTTGTTGGMGNWDDDYPSCENLAQDACGGDNCCATDAVPGGWFAMGRGEQSACPSTPEEGQACTDTTATCFDDGATWGCPTGTWMDLGGDDSPGNGGADEIPEHAARVDFYGLDRYEVTVGRMREFVDSYDKAALLTLLDGGAGAHPTAADTEWDNAWDIRLPEDADALRAALACNDTQTWTDSPGDNETYPINCVSWYLAYAFCAWDEGRLPTGAEWERAAIGGEENRLYPWGTDAPSGTLANYSGSDNTPEIDVFAKPDGAGRWGHEQIGGSVWEWVYDTHDSDWYTGDGNDCENCANMADEGAKVMRGGDFQYDAADLRGANRFPGTAAAYWLGSGIRCARD